MTQQKVFVETDEQYKERIFKIKKEEIIQDIRNLRDSDFHVCLDSLFYATEGREGKEGECTCGEFNAVIDKIEQL